MLDEVVAAAQSDLEAIEASLSSFEQIRINKSTSVGELKDRFPEIAREVEEEIKEHHWHSRPSANASDHHH